MLSLSIYKDLWAKASLFDHDLGAEVHIGFGTEEIGSLFYVAIKPAEARRLAEELRVQADKAERLNALRSQLKAVKDETAA